MKDTSLCAFDVAYAASCVRCSFTAVGKSTWESADAVVPRVAELSVDGSVPAAASTALSEEGLDRSLSVEVALCSTASHPSRCG